MRNILLSTLVVVFTFVIFLVFTPKDVLAVCPMPAPTSVTADTNTSMISWSAVPEAETYMVRVDHAPSSFSGGCGGAQNAGDMCVDFNNPTSLQYVNNSGGGGFVPGETYDIWVHGYRNSDGCWGNATHYTFTQPSASVSLGEALDNLSYTWLTGGSNSWTGQTTTSFNGGDAAQSGTITDTQSTWLQTTVTGPGTLGFYWTVSSESGFDFLKFAIDGVQQNQISGSTAWASQTYNLTSGSHTLTWTYTKDGSVSSGSDRGWVDLFTYTAVAPTNTPTPTPVPPTPTPNPNLTAVNFQLAGSPIPAGYLPDYGDTYAARNGKTYGWNINHTDTSRDRNAVADQRLDTIVQFHVGGVWEIAVPNGTYSVFVSVGDAAFGGSFTSTNTINVEGVNYWTNQWLNGGSFASLTKTVTVSDGKLTIDNGSSADKNTKINYVEITAVVPPTATPTPTNTPTPTPTPTNTPTPTPTPVPVGCTDATIGNAQTGEYVCSGGTLRLCQADNTFTNTGKTCASSLACFADCNTPGSNVFNACYFNNGTNIFGTCNSPTYTNTVYQTVDGSWNESTQTLTLNHPESEWGYGSPNPLVNNDCFSGQYLGTFNNFTGGDYFFHLTANNTATLYLDGVSQVTDTNASTGDSCATVNITPGQHTIKLLYTENNNRAGVTAVINKTNTCTTPITPTPILCPSINYWNPDNSCTILSTGPVAPGGTNYCRATNVNSGDMQYCGPSGTWISTNTFCACNAAPPTLTPTNTPTPTPTLAAGATPPPSCSLSGPSSLTTGQSANYTGSCSDSQGQLSSIELYWSPTTSQTWNYVGTPCASSGSNGTCTQGAVFNSPGTYYVAVNGYKNGASVGSGTSSTRCTGNPFPGSPAAGWSDCGGSDWIQVTVSNPVVSSHILTISSVDQNNQAITGYYTTISPSDNAGVSWQYTTTNFILTDNQSYTVNPQNYNGVNFDHWEDNGSTSPFRTVSINSNTTLVAVYVNTFAGGGGGGGTSPGGYNYCIGSMSVDSSGSCITTCNWPPTGAQCVNGTCPVCCVESRPDGCAGGAATILQPIPVTCGGSICAVTQYCWDNACHDPDPGGF